MICSEGYKAFRGTMRIVPKNPNMKLYELTADWLYKPEYQCWYGRGSSFPEEICEVLVDLTETPSKDAHNMSANGPIINDGMFGAYVKIPTGASGEMHVYKVIGRIESNGYCDVPIMGGMKATPHSEIVPVLNVVHCGVSEDTVIRAALSDCEIVPPPNDPLTMEQLREMDGEPVYLDFVDGGEWVLVRAYEGKVFITHKNTICSPANLVLMCRGKICCRKPEDGAV